MSTQKPLTIDIVSDVVCPWCYIGKKRIEDALKLVPDVPVEVRWRPFFLNPWVPREGMSREDSYAAVQRNAMEAWRGNASFLALCRADKDIRQFLADDELVALFDLGYHTKHVDTIFKRVFG